MKDINVTVSDGNILELSTTPLILKKNESYRLIFDLDAWDGNTPVCRFRDAAGHYVDKELDSNNSCVVPALTALITYVGLYSYDGVHSSTFIRLNALESTLSQLDGVSDLLTDEEIKTLKTLAETDFSGVLSLEETVNQISENIEENLATKTDLSSYVLVTTLPTAISEYVNKNIDTLKGEKGERGYSAFEIAQQNDSSIESVYEWLASLKGEKGADGANGSSVTVNIDDNTAGQHTVMFTDVRGNHTTIIYDGTNGEPGTTPVKGIDYFTSAEIADIESTILNNVINAFETEVLDGEY